VSSLVFVDVVVVAAVVPVVVVVVVVDPVVAPPVYANVGPDTEVPFGFVTRTETVLPGGPGGALTSICVSESTFTIDAPAAPKAMWVADESPFPVIVTSVPPAAGRSRN